MNDERIFELQRRLERIEEERAIERMIASYGPLVDPVRPTPQRICGPPTEATTSKAGRCEAARTLPPWCVPMPTRV